MRYIIIFQLKKSCKTIFLGLLSVSMILLTACDVIVTDSFENTLVENVVTISGSVGDGPIVGAKVFARDSSGIVIGVGSSDEYANYQVTVPRQSNFPLVISSTGGIDTVSLDVPSFDLYSIIESSQNITVNINPYSTFITKIAENMPYSFTRLNVAIATKNVVEKLNYGLDPNLVQDGPVKSKISATNIAVIVKSSEAFSEMIRRVRASLQEHGINISANEVIDILAYDFIDGFIDGTGVHEHAPRIAALANIINASVLLESMSNQLKVGGNDVSSAMDSAIRLTMPTVPVSVSTDDVPINKAMVYQAIVALDAAMTIAPSQEIASLISVVESIEYGTSSESVASTISLDLYLTFSPVISALQSAGLAQINAVNSKARNKFLALINNTTGGGSTGGGSTGGGSTGGGSTGGGSTGGGSTGGGSTGGGSTGGGSTGGGSTGGGSTGGGSTGGGSTGGGSTGGGSTGGGSGGGSNSNAFNGDITTTAPASYVWSSLEINSKVFVDRTFEYTNVPTELIGLDVLRTENDDKNISSNALVVFDISEVATVYVAHDIRITDKPAWLAGWSDTGITIVDSDTTRRLFSNNHAAGTVVLGSNNNSNSDSSMYSVIVRNLDGSVPTAKPIAVNDVVTTDMDTAVNIDVLLNDRDLDDTPISLSIVDSPSVGTVNIEANDTITYTPDGVSYGAYNFTYRITDNDGDLATASVSINVLCSNCANDIDVSLTWDANSASENVNGYNILYRLSTDASNKLLADVPVSQTGFDATNPSVSFNAGADIGLVYGDNVCFSVQAYNYVGTSAATTEACTDIEAVN